MTIKLVIGCLLLLLGIKCALELKEHGFHLPTSIFMVIYFIIGFILTIQEVVANS